MEAGHTEPAGGAERAGCCLALGALASVGVNVSSSVSRVVSTAVTGAFIAIPLAALLLSIAHAP